VYILPSRFEQAIPGSEFFEKKDFEAVTNTFSIFLSVNEGATDLHKVLGIRNIGKASIFEVVDEIIEHHTTMACLP
jgi:hypothetical protein